MDNQDIKAGDLVLYKGGLFRVNGLAERAGAFGLVKTVLIGDTSAPIDKVRKADHRDVIRITKGGPSQ